MIFAHQTQKTTLLQGLYRLVHERQDYLPVGVRVMPTSAELRQRLPNYHSSFPSMAAALGFRARRRGSSVVLRPLHSPLCFSGYK